MTDPYSQREEKKRLIKKRLETLLLDEGFPAGELKEFLLLHMGTNPNHAINPEEGLLLIDKRESEKGKEDERPSSLFYQEFFKEQNNFYNRYWCDKIMPILKTTEVIELISTLQADLGDKFMPSLETYAKQVKK